MARAVDVHDKISNPSLMFEVEIIDEGGFIYQSFKPYYFSETTKRKPEKSFRRDLKILPAVGQVIINEDKSKIKDTAKGIKNVVLGIKKESLWGKTFKFRITSKHSGKKIDVNVKFQSSFNSGKSSAAEEEG